MSNQPNTTEAAPLRERPLVGAPRPALRVVRLHRWRGPAVNTRKPYAQLLWTHPLWHGCLDHNRNHCPECRTCDCHIEDRYGR